MARIMVVDDEPEFLFTVSTRTMAADALTRGIPVLVPTAKEKFSASTASSRGGASAPYPDFVSLSG